MQTSFLNDDYWSNRYLQNETGWDISQPSTPIKQYIDQLENRNISILIPGCGNAYEAEYLLQQGFTNITLIDISQVLVENLKKRFEGTPVKIFHTDFFETSGAYDLIFEQTFFCALHPSLRINYTQQMKRLLTPNGKLVGVMFSTFFEGGPPFGGSLQEYLQLFGEVFTIKTLEECYNSIEPRKGREVFIILEANKNTGL